MNKTTVDDREYHHDYRKINLSSIFVEDLDGNKQEIKGFGKNIANLLYFQTNSVDIIEIARDINAGKEVPLTEELLSNIEKLVYPNITAIARLALEKLISNI